MAADECIDACENCEEVAELMATDDDVLLCPKCWGALFNKCTCGPDYLNSECPRHGKEK